VVDEKWSECRREKCRGDLYHTHQPEIDVKLLVTKAQETYNDTYAEGCVQSIWNFNEARRLGFHEGVDADEVLIRAIEEKYPRYTIKKENPKDEDSDWVVDMPDNHDGVRRYRRGIRDASIKQKQQVHAGRASADEDHAHNTGLLSSIDARARDESEEEDDEEDDDEEDGAKSEGGNTVITQKTVSHKQGPDEPHTVNSSGPGSVCSRGSKKRERNDDGTEGKGEAPPVKKRRSALEAALESAHAQIELVKASYGHEAHWEQWKRRRDFDTFTSGLNRVARRCGGFLQSDDAQGQSSKLFTLVAFLQERQSFFEILHSSVEFCRLVMLDALEDLPHQMFLDFKPETLGGFFTMEAQKLSDRIFTEDGSLEAFLRILPNHSVMTKRLCFGLAKNPDVVLSAQTSLVVGFAETVWKHGNVNAIVNVGQTIVKRFPALPCDPSTMEMNKSFNAVTGLSNQAVVDLSFLVVGTRVLEAMQQSTDIPRSLRKTSAKFVECKGNISARHKLFLKGVHGLHSQHGKHVWNKMTDFYDTFGSTQADSAQLTLTSAKMTVVAEKLELALSRDWQSVNNAVVDILEPEGAEDEIKVFGHTWSDVKESEASDEVESKCCKTAAAISEMLLSAVDLVLEGRDHYACFEETVACGQVAPDTRKKMQQDGIDVDVQQDRELEDSEVDGVEPDVIFDLNWQLSALDVLSNFRTPADSVVLQAKAFTELYLRTWDVAKMLGTIEKPKEASLAMTLWPSVWQQSTAIPTTTEKFKEGQPGSSLQAWTETMSSSLFVKRNVVKLATALISSASSAAVALSEYEKNTDGWPSEVATIMEAGQAVAKLDDFDRRQSSHKLDMSILDLAKLRQQVTTARTESTESIFVARGYGDFVMLDSEFKNALDVLQGRVKKGVAACEAVTKEFNNVATAVKDWTVGTCTELVEENDAAKMATKSAKDYNVQFQNITQLVERTKLHMEGWSDASFGFFGAQFFAFAESLATREEQLKATCSLIATCLLSTITLKAEKEKASKGSISEQMKTNVTSVAKYCTDTLHVPEETWPEMLREHVRAVQEKKTVQKTPPSTVDSPLPKSAKPVESAMTPMPTAPPVKKMLKRVSASK